MMRRVLLLVLAAAVSMGARGADRAEPPRIAPPRPAPATPSNIPTPPPAYFDPTLAVGGPDLKARKDETRLSVDVHVDGRGPYHFIVDSGADTSVVGLRIARDLQLPLGTPVILNGMTNRNIVDRVKVGELTVGTNSIDNLELPALRESDLGGDGMIGIDALAHQRLMLDFDKRLIKVEDARVREPHYANEIVITARRQHGQLILAHVKAVGYDLDAIIDTGSEITIGNMALRDKLIRGNRDKFIIVPVVGVTGEVKKLEVARIGEVQIGPVTLRDVPMAFADVPPFRMFGLTDQPALLLGTDLLENFSRVSLDFKARKVRFLLRHCDTVVMINGDQDMLTRVSADRGQQACAN